MADRGMGICVQKKRGQKSDRESRELSTRKPGEQRVEEPREL